MMKPDQNELAPGRPGPRKVLVVDDNPDVAELMLESLSVLGYEVRIALDGPSALAMVEDFAPDVALLDIGLPVMDGHELAGRMHALVSGTRFIALTGYGQETDRIRSREAGFALHLVKPIDLATLWEGVRQVMDSVAPSSSR